MIGNEHANSMHEEPRVKARFLFLSSNRGYEAPLKYAVHHALSSISTSYFYNALPLCYNTITVPTQQPVVNESALIV
jgi:hypothetical protein